MSTLKQLVDETTNIRKEIVNCYSSLKTNLTNKYVEVSNNDKLSSLISKVLDINTYKRIAGTEKVYMSDSNEYSATNTSNFEKLKTYEINDNFESARFNFTNTSGGGYIKCEYVQDGKILRSTQYSSDTPNITFDMSNVKKGDKVVFYGKATSSGPYMYYASFVDFNIKYSIKILD